MFLRRVQQLRRRTVLQVGLVSLLAKLHRGQCFERLFKLNWHYNVTLCLCANRDSYSAVPDRYLVKMTHSSLSRHASLLPSLDSTSCQQCLGNIHVIWMGLFRFKGLIRVKSMVHMLQYKTACMYMAWDFWVPCAVHEWQLDRGHDCCVNKVNNVECTPEGSTCFPLAFD
eukprot:1152576-Pelagomonas_calceolata.AAC.2